jgi:hypothetical protein
VFFSDSDPNPAKSFGSDLLYSTVFLFVIFRVKYKMMNQSASNLARPDLIQTDSNKQVSKPLQSSKRFKQTGDQTPTDL